MRYLEVKVKDIKYCIYIYIYIYYLVKAIKQESTLNSETDRIDRLRELFNGINKNTAKEDLYWHIKMSMFVTLAKKEG